MDQIKRQISVWLPPLLALLIAWINPMGWPINVCLTLAIMVWMLSWWLMETVPMAVTALLPILLFPLFGISTIEQACAPFGDKFIFLFLGGFLLALALEKSGLHKRFSLSLLKITGNSASKIILGFMLSAWFISMWISNTATTLMMFPIALAVSNLFDKSVEKHNKTIRHFRVSLFLGIAYASSIGGMATIIGSPPNAAAVGILNKTFGREISFTDWMIYGLPFSLILLFLAYWAMTKLIFPLKNEKFDKGRDFILEELNKMGNWKPNEKRILGVFAVAIALWLSEGVIRSIYPSYPISDVWIAMAAGIALFLLPGEESKPILNWEDTRNLPWGILLMFGGGLSLAMAFKESGTLKLLTDSLAVLNYLDDQLYLVLLTGIGLLLTAFMSNLAMVTLFVPVVASLALNKGIDPMYFAIPVTLSASCDFMFPMSTPPNAIAFSSGHIRSKEMLKAGIVLNLISFLLLVIFILIN